MATDIQYLRHNEIDKTRWDASIRSAVNGLIYAKADFLDAMSPGWHALVADDYAAVMPVTWRKKMGIRYVCQPAFCQQLGLFYGDEKYRSSLPDFLELLKTKFRLIEMNLNFANEPQNHSSPLNNFLLPLEKGYVKLHADLSPRFIQSLKRAARYPMEYIKGGDASEIIDAYYESYGDRMHVRPQDISAFKSLTEKYSTQYQALVRCVRQLDGSLLAGTILLRDEKRFYNIINVITGNGRTLEANYFLYGQMLQEMAPTGLLLDFEGSDLPGVALFYQKFRPVNQPYSYWKYDRLPAIVRWLKS